MESVKSSLGKYQFFHDRRMEKGKWYWMEKAVIHLYAPKIGFVGIAVYNCLALMADSKQTCYPSQGYIAKALGCSRSTVNRAIKTLVRNGLIGIDKTARYPQCYHLLKVGCSTDTTGV